MSNILIIKHGSLGDIVQISGVLHDIKEENKDKKIFILTTIPYVDLLSRCHFLDGVIVDKRLPRWNFLYLIKLRKMLKKFNFSYVYDLQNSSRTSFYRKHLLNIPNWSSAETILKKNEKRNFFINESVLKRFQIQLEESGIKSIHTLKPDFSWAAVNVDKIINKHFSKKFILIFPFCSPQLSHKKWPYYNNLINLIKSNHPNLEIGVVPGPKEFDEANKIKSIIVKNKNVSLNIMELTGVISKSSYVIANDTGPAHIAAHLGKNGVVLFGQHTTPKKVSIETEKFKSIVVDNLQELTAEKVYSEISNKLKLIN